MKDTNPPSSSILCPSLVALEHRSDIRLPLNKVYSREMRVVVDEGDPIDVTMLTSGG